MKINNVNTDKLQDVIKEIKGDLSKAKRANNIEGEWNLKGGAQFTSEITYENGKAVLKSDQPTFLDGGGTEPGPMFYCLYGIASCYTATFATMAAMEGVELKRLKVNTESRIDFSKVFGLSENPIIEGVNISLHVESDAPKDKILELEKLAKERCPAVYYATNPIKLETELLIER